ncbi:MAG: potassium transporter Kup [Gammaproteobacteria bacterium]
MAVALAVLGVVYGDLGTSPIYALRQGFIGATPVAVDPLNVLGVLSLIFWTLIIVISLKYMIFVLQANNRGEGGTFALIALLRPWRGLDRRRRHLLILFALFGAALLYGGVIITPAISILSAVEGLKVATPFFKPYVVPVTIVILVLLFAFQHKGTARVGSVFGPIMTVWFLVIGGLGLASIVHTPQVLVALNPYYAAQFLLRDGWVAFLVLYAVFLVTTGGEALYADLGHFGRWPIRWMWFGFVLPALLFNYFGQGALLLRSPTGAFQPFYHLAPHWFLYPLVVLATAATIIASQAAITGAFSLTRQAIQLGMMPRFRVTQTSEEVHGQIYVPMVNWVLMIATIGVVLMFRSSSALAAAYGAAVNGTMIVTTVLAFNVAREVGGWKRPAAFAFLAGFLTVDLFFFSSNVMKIPDGGWFPILIGALFFIVMSTWRRGSEILERQAGRNAEPLETLIGELSSRPVARVPGTAVFLTGRLEDCPPALRHHVRRNKALQEQVIVLTVLAEDVARVAHDKRIEVKNYEQGFSRMILHYGYMQGVNVPSELVANKVHDLEVDLDDVTYYVGSQSLVPSSKEGGMVGWRDQLFAFMARNAMNPTYYYHIPANQTVVLGLRVRI